ncbi:hypothetical protein ACIBI7_54355 [Nonomuraea fuscirosea]|uniref:hypothetical protein n=1 Tax=Nonomuraea fuscirosea TaxID=1291556 RepID=UPI0037ABA10E
MGADLSLNIFIERASGRVSELPLVMAIAVTAFICGVWLSAVIAGPKRSQLVKPSS